MKRFPLAIQLYSVRDSISKDFTGTLEEIKKMGYDGVELVGLYGKKPKELAAIFDSLELYPISAHVSIEDMINDPVKTVESYAQVGCAYIAIPYAAPEYRVGGGKFIEFLTVVSYIGELADSYGMGLLYHNHAFEFEKTGDSYKLDHIYSQFPPYVLKTELDTCWVNVGGEDPCKYIEKYKGRAPIVHLKDFVGSDNGMAFSYQGKNREDIPPFTITALGEGVQNMPAIIEAAEKADTSWLVYEQDMPNGGRSSLECAKISIDYYNSLFN